MRLVIVAFWLKNAATVPGRYPKPPIAEGIAKEIDGSDWCPNFAHYCKLRCHDILFQVSHITILYYCFFLLLSPSYRVHFHVNKIVHNY